MGTETEDRFDRIEGYIDAIYDAAYGVLDTVFIGVDKVFAAAKNYALRGEQRRSQPPMGWDEVAQAVVSYYKEHSPNSPVLEKAQRMVKHGVYDIDWLTAVWSGKNPDDPRVG